MPQHKNLQFLRATRPPQQPHQRAQVPHDEIHERPEQSAFDNALAESFVDSYKTELIADRVWRSRSQLELAVVEYVGWFNQARLHESLGDLPPSEFEALYATQTEPTTPIK